MADPRLPAVTPMPGRPNPEPDPPHHPDEPGDEVPEEEGDDEKRRPGRD